MEKPEKPERPQCIQIKDNGERCQVRIAISPRNGLCFTHDPKRAEARKAAWNKGAMMAARALRRRTPGVSRELAPPDPESLEDCAKWASWLTVALTTGLIDPRTCREAVNAINSLRGSVEKLNLDARIKALEESAKAQTARAGLRVTS